MHKIKLTLIFLSILFFSTGCSNLDIQLLNQKAVQLMNEGDIEGAIARLVSINDLNPNFAETHYNLGVAYEQQEKYKLSIESFKKTVELKKDFADAYYSLGVVYEKMAYEIIDKNFTDKQNLKNVKLCSEDSENLTDYLNKSIESFEQYIAINPKAPDKEEVSSKISQLNEDIKDYCHYELKK